MGEVIWHWLWALWALPCHGGEVEMVQCLQPSSSWHSYLIHFLLQRSIRATLPTWGGIQRMAPVLCLGRSLALLLSAAAGSVPAVEKKDFPWKLLLLRPKHFCDTAGLWKTDTQQTEFVHCWEDHLGVSILYFWGSAIPRSCHIPLHPLQVKMQNCSLEGNYFLSTLLNSSSGLACLTYKNLELVRKRENWNKGAHSSSLFELNSFTLFRASLGQQHWRSIAAAGRAALTHPAKPSSSLHCCSNSPAWTPLLEQELCTGRVQPSHLCLLSPQGCSWCPKTWHNPFSGRTDTLLREQEEKLSGSGPLCEKVSRTATFDGCAFDQWGYF